MASRNVDVWLPPGYPEGGPYPVIYMHDGQNLFRPETAFVGIDWSVDKALTRLAQTQGVRYAMIVGIWNTPERIAEYMPRKPFEQFMHADRQAEWIRSYGSPDSDNYLAFVVEELKPFIDCNYSTLPNRPDTYIMGSSMGGLVSIYALCEYAASFNGAGCLSTHWPAADGVVLDYLRTALPDPSLHRIYFDHGTETLDSEYRPYQSHVDGLMRNAGYVHGENWITRIFPGEEHSERAWKERVAEPLAFLLEKS